MKRSDRMDRATLSVIIPVKDEERNLERLLPALLEQSSPPHDIVVAVAPSTKDRSREVVEKYHPHARWVDGGMPGPGRNAGARHTHGKTLLFLDADAMPGSGDFLHDIVEGMREQGLGLATTDHAGIGATLGERCYFGIYNSAQRLMARSKRPFACGTVIAARRDVHEAIGGFDERWAFYEDSDYIQRGVAAGYRFDVLDRSVNVDVDPRRLRKDGSLRVLINGIRADRYARKHGIITDLGLIDSTYFEHKNDGGTTRYLSGRFPTRFFRSNIP